MTKFKHEFKSFLTIGNMAGGIALAALITGLIILNSNLNSPENVTKKLEEKGYTQVVVGDYAFWCPKGYSIRRHFTAQDIAGQNVEGKFCGAGIDFFDQISTEVVKSKKLTP